MIEIKVIRKGSYSKKEKEILDRMYDDYRREIKIGHGPYLIEEFWKGVESGKQTVLLAVDKKSDKPLGFLRLITEKENGKKKMWFNDYYLIPEARGVGLSNKLSKKGYYIGRMQKADIMKTSVPATDSGKVRVSKKFGEKQKQWATIPPEKFENLGSFMTKLKRKHFK